MESEFLALSKQEALKFKTIDEEKRILLGAVLIPDKPIYRNQNGREFYVSFPKETINLAMEGFFKNGFQNNSTYEHDEKQQLSNVTIVESWIKEDETHDKSVKLGFSEPVGTWFATMKINNDEVWNDYVKTGKVKGFSIDGYFDMERINLKSQIKMSAENKDLFEAIALAFKNVFNPKKNEEKIELGQIMNETQDLTIYFEGDMLAKDMEVWLQDENGEKMPVPDGEYVLESGMTIIVSNSLISEIKEPTPQDQQPAEMAEETTSATPQVKSEKVTQEVFYQLSEMQMNEFAKTIGKIIEDTEVKLRAEFEAKLSGQEFVSLTKNKPAKEKPYEEMTALERYRASKN